MKSSRAPPLERQTPTRALSEASIFMSENAGRANGSSCGTVRFICPERIRYSLPPPHPTLPQRPRSVYILLPPPGFIRDSSPPYLTIDSTGAPY